MKWAQLYNSLNIFGFTLLWDGSENWPFPVLWPLLNFPNLFIYWVQHIHNIIFRILNSSVGIPSPPLALFVVVLPKAHLTSHSMMSDARWVTTSSWLSRSLRPFLYSSVYLCHPFLISSASVKSLLFLSFSMPSLAWNIPLISPFSWRDF